MSVDERRGCPRCGFAVNTRGATEQGRARLVELLEEHLTACPYRPDAELRRKLKREVRSAQFLYGRERAVEVAENVLAEAKP